MNWKHQCEKVIKFLFYMVLIGTSIPYFISISNGLLNNFFATTITFNLDTLFLNWNTSFPGITVCELYNGEKIWEISDSYFGTEHDLRLDDIVGEIVYYRGSCTMCDLCENSNLSCPENFTEILETFKSKCSDLIQNCKYLNAKFECCEEFLPLYTEYGLCYAFNSNQARKSAEVQYNNNRAVGIGFITFETPFDVQLHIHSPIDVPHLQAEGMIRETVYVGSNKEVILTAIEVYNHPSIYQMDIESRKCRFVNELTEWGKKLKLFDLYSLTSCLVECTLAIQLRLCNCSNHLLFKEKDPRFSICDYEGLLCLSDYYYEILEERRECDCMSPCEEPDYNIIYNSADEVQSDQKFTRITIALAELPNLRYVRRVTKSNLDLMISIGGLAGLFFNASLVRVVEMVFLVFKFRWKLKRK